MAKPTAVDAPITDWLREQFHDTVVAWRRVVSRSATTFGGASTQSFTPSNFGRCTEPGEFVPYVERCSARLGPSVGQV